MKLYLLSIALFCSLFCFGQITRGGTTESPKQAPEAPSNPRENFKAPAHAVDCNVDIEMDPGNKLIYHRKTNKPYTGVCISYHENSKRQRVAKFVDGKEQDTSYSYYKTGSPWTITGWDNGIENGEWKFWYENGNLAWENTYELGQKTGTWRFFFEDGSIKKVLNYKNDLLDGECKYYKKGGKLKKLVNYRSGEFNGELYYLLP